jgi:hypothetical protein
MWGNDIQEYAPISQALVFEGLLATPPTGASKALELLRRRKNDWDGVLRTWTVNELPLKALSDSINRLGLGTDIYTFLDPEAPDAIDKWLMRKGVSTPVYFYESPEMLEYDLRFQRAVRVVYTSDEEVAKVLGFRAQVVSPDRAWTP